MGRIQVLPIQIANKIAAGEVVERPASVIKELVENSVDAGATSISVEIREGGISYMRVADNGNGMSRDDAKTCFLRHATSKIHAAEDLSHISTLGFRGEALASIAAVARVTLKTHMHDDEFGTQIQIDGGNMRDVTPCGCPDGTIIEVEDLFFNVPARKKFLKAARTEAAYVSDYMLRMILSRPHISFRLINNGTLIYHSTGDGSLKNAIYSVYGAELIPHLRAVSYEDEYIKIEGYAGSEHLTKPNRTFQSFFVNGRYIRSQKLSIALMNAYDTRIMGGRFPIAVISINLAFTEVDVNVHPNKLEIRFADEERVFSLVNRAVKAALGETSIPTYTLIRDEANERIHSTEQPTLPEENKDDLFKKLMEQANFSGTEQSKSEKPADSVQRDTTKAAQTVRQETDSRRTEIVNAEVEEEKLPVYTPPEQITPPPRSGTMLTQIKLDANPFVVIGNLFDSFWLISQNENLFIMDQHAAHERMIYEQFKKGELRASSQILLVPFIVKLTNEEYNVYADNRDLFAEFGFEIEEFGTLTLRISAVPHILKKAEDEQFFRDALAELSKHKSVTLQDLKRDALITASCKAAVKLGNIVPEKMIESLLKEYAEEGITLTCPHGRPVMFAITKRDLLKKFKRIL